MPSKILAILLLLSVLAVPAAALGQLIEEENSESMQGSDSAAEQSLDLAHIAERIVQKTNDFRKEHDRSPVEVDSQLKETAQYFADYMARTDRYGHTADGNRPAQRAKQHNYAYCIVSENIAYAYRSTGFSEEQLSEKFTQGWIDSPEHRQNMLDFDVTETGVAVAHSGKSGNYYAVQMFGRPKAMSINFSVSNRSDAEIEYEIGKRVLPLPPHYTRTHEQCRPSQLKFQLATDGEPERSKTVEPERGDRFVVVASSGQLEVEESQGSAAAARSSDPRK